MGTGGAEEKGKEEAEEYVHTVVVTTHDDQYTMSQV